MSNPIVERKIAEFEKILKATDQPCENFEIFEVSVSGSGPQPHQCPHCEGLRYFCANCHQDHHDGGWRLCELRQSCESALEEQRKGMVERIEKLETVEGSITDGFKAVVLHIITSPDINN